MSLGDYFSSLRLHTSALVHNRTMDFGSLFEYVNPFACPLNIFEEQILGTLLNPNAKPLIAIAY